MLNIISRSANEKRIGGQVKVFQNLIKGLGRIGYPYVVNRRLDACEKLWIHDDTRALPLLASLPPRVKVIVGPNLYVMPRDMPKKLDLSRAIYLHPSEWAVQIWQAQGFNLCPLKPWPVGIDTELFGPVPYGDRDQVLIYHKHRDPGELAQTKCVVEKMGLQYENVIYGSYRQDDFLEQLGVSKYVIWHGCHESQGIALLEALARNIPILLWDVVSLGQFRSSSRSYRFLDYEKQFAATAAPYFDSTCGIRILSIGELEAAIHRMEMEWHTFQSRSFVVHNLSLEKQAGALLDFYGDWRQEAAKTADHASSRMGKWRPPLRSFIRGGLGRLQAYLRRA